MLCIGKGLLRGEPSAVDVVDELAPLPCTGGSRGNEGGVAYGPVSGGDVGEVVDEDGDAGLDVRHLKKGGRTCRG